MVVASSSFHVLSWKVGSVRSLTLASRMPSLFSILMTYFRSFSAFLQFTPSHCRSSQELLLAAQTLPGFHEQRSLLGLTFLLAAVGNVRETLRGEVIPTAYYEPKRRTCCGSRASEHMSTSQEADFDRDTTSESTRTNSTVITNRTGQNQFGEALGRRLAHEDPSQPHTLLRPHQ